MITWENYEEYIMMHADGELLPAEQQELKVFIEAHPELKNEMALYEAAHITVDSSLVYDKKETLLKPVPAKRIIAFLQWCKYSIAASIAALLFISFFRYRNVNDNEKEMTKVDVVNRSSVPALSGSDKSLQPQQSVAAVQEKAPVTAPVRKKSSYIARSSAGVMGTHGSSENKVQHRPVEMAVKVTEIMPVMPVAEVKQMPCENSGRTSPQQKEVPVFALAEDKTSDRRSFIDRLPIDEIKKNELKNITGSIADVYDGLSERGGTADEKKVSIKIRKQKLIVSF
jgi:hypothetical protein